MNVNISDLSLEDTFADVVTKAMQGLGLSEVQLARRTAVELARLAAVLAGAAPTPREVETLAGALQLAPAALAELARGLWHPRPARIPAGFAGFTSPFLDLCVNSYLLWDPAAAAAAMFDTGTDARPALAAIDEGGLTLRYLFVTHSHGDHVGDIRRVLAAHPGAELIGSPRERGPAPAARRVADGDTIAVGRLSVEVLETPGHSPGGLSFVVRGGEPAAAAVAVVGDALFAASIGRPNVSYTALLASLRDKIMTLSQETILAPGHGPYTTVGEEKMHNPFLAGGART